MKARKEFIAKMQKKLLERKAQLTNQLNQQAGERIFEEQVKDKGDEALTVSFERLQSSLEESEIKQLHKVDEALARIEKGSYGQCVDCGENIGDKRLTNFPFAARCIVCQEAHEG